MRRSVPSTRISARFKPCGTNYQIIPFIFNHSSNPNPAAIFFDLLRIEHPLNLYCPFTDSLILRTGGPNCLGGRLVRSTLAWQTCAADFIEQGTVADFQSAGGSSCDSIGWLLERSK